MIKLKKKVHLIVLLGIIGIAVSGFSLYGAASTEENSVGSDEIKVYYFRHESFQRFIKEPSWEILKESGNKWGVTVYQKLDSGGIRCEEIDEVFPSVVESEEGKFKIGKDPYIHVYSSLIDFVNDKENLTTLFAENGVEAREFEETAVFYTPNIPVTIWLRTNQENYFITINRNEEFYDGNDDNPYTYKLYSYFDYCDKYGVKDGKLLINGEDITQGNYVKIYTYGAYLPLRAVMEKLGVKVDWDTEKNVARLTINGEDFILNPAELSFVPAQDPDPSGKYIFDMRILPPGSGSSPYECFFIDDRIIMNDSAMRLILTYLMGIKLHVSYDDLTIKIFQETY